MSTSTAGIQLKTERRALASAIELLSSMRFAISLLSVLAIASVIGTVLKQNEPMPNYVNQFGPFWFDVFGKVGLYSVYSAWWFLLILAFLVMSTSLCIARNAPRMLADMRSWRENVREQSLRNFHHKAEWRGAQDQAQLVQQTVERVTSYGYRVRVVQKDQATLITAKQGAAIDTKGPMPCAISRIAGYFRNQIVMTAASAAPLQRVLAEVRDKGGLAKGDRIAVDVDPVSLL